MRRFSYILGFLILLVGCSGGDNPDNEEENGPGNAGTPLQITAAASRSSGVAPLGVVLNAGINAEDRTFHDREYIWDFGDTGSGSWAATGASKNSDKGPVAAHVFETPGQYSVALRVKDGSGSEAITHFSIEVQDPEAVYAGADTTCISDTYDFSGCPAGAVQVITDDITEMEDYVATGRRVLLRRGSQWTTDGEIDYRNIEGPVTVGAFGDCQNPDGRGICENAPQIDLVGDTAGGIFNLYKTSDWRIEDLHITGETTRWGAIGGNTDLNAVLLLRLKTEGFNVPMGNSHWDTDGHDQMMVVACDLADAQSNILYIGSERLAVMGNRLRNPAESHVLRVWQAYIGVIGHNDISGASLFSDAGRHAIKLHGPSQEILASAGNGEDGLVHPSRFIVITGNLIGGSGPWPVCVGPQDSGHDERVRDIIIEKNRFLSGYGDISSTPVQVALSLSACNVTVRNNIFEGTDSSAYFTAIRVTRRGVEPAPTGNHIFNNTIYKADVAGGYSALTGISIDSMAGQTVVRNNLAYLAPSASEVVLIADESPDLTADHNLLTHDNLWVDPENIDFLQQDFSLQAQTPAIDAGDLVPVYDDFSGAERPQGAYFDLGAFEW